MSSVDPAEREQRLDEAVLAYLKAREVDAQLNPQPWMEQYPDLKDDLDKFLQDQSRLKGLADLLRLLTDGPLKSDAETHVWKAPQEASAANCLKQPKFEDYEILEEIGRGGMGRVYK